MVAKKQRLFKIASEINISKDEIHSFLVSKGFEIDSKPTSMLTPEMIDIVYDKFKREKRAAEQQREKLEKHRVLRHPKDDQADSDDEEVTKPVEDKKHELTAEETTVEVEVVEKIEEIQPEEDQQETPKKDTGPAVGEIIDLGDTRRKSRGKKSAKKSSREDAKPVEVKKTTKKTTKKTEQKAKPKQEAKPSEASAVEKSKEKTQVKEEPIPTPPKVDKKETPAEAEAKETGKKRRKSNKILKVEPEDNKLKGLTIVGKIELEKEKRRKKKVIGKKTKDTGSDEQLDTTKLFEGPKKKIKKPRPVEKEAVDTEAGKRGKKPDDRKRRKRKKSIREQISEKDVDKAIKATLAGMSDSSGSGGRSKIKQKKRAEREEKELKISEEKERVASTLELTEFVTTADLANLMEISTGEIILKCMELGMMVTINQRLDKDTITLIADDYGYEVIFVDPKALVFDEEEEEDESLMVHRSPIVTIMGHVDHGKTSLIDFIRNTSIVAGEAGGITQHIGAYRVDLDNGRAITFLDTPGHEAFTAMRARGAQVTDIVVLVVAADDSVMPQTIEAISHSRAAKVPIVVAINKIDKPEANPDRIKQQLADHNVLVEDWGGKVQSVQISAKSGENIDVLLEKILLEAEMLELKANPKRDARGVVIEANMDKGFGATASVVVQKGNLQIGDPFVAGVCSGKVRGMFDERGNKVTSVGPSIPVKVIGFDSLPTAGDGFMVVDNEHDARSISNERSQLKREQELRQVHYVTLDEISAQIQIGGVQELKLIIKGDVWGSVEALADSLEKLSHEEVKVVILHKGIGGITENDVNLAVASGTIIIGFNTSTTAAARRQADKEKVDIRLYNIIYDCINEIQLALEGLLTPDKVEEITSEIEIRKVFKISKFGNIAGCYVLNGKITRNDKIRLLRDGLVVFEGTIHSLKRNKDDVKEVNEGYECGIQINNFSDIEEGDIIQSIKISEVKRKFKD